MPRSPSAAPPHPRPTAPDPARWTTIAGLLLTAALFGGCSGSGNSEPPEGPPAASAVGSSGAPIDEPPGALACGEAVLAVRDGSLMNAGVVAAITEAAGTADAPVADAAQELSTAYAKAVAAHDTDAEPDAVAAVSAAAAALVKVCGDSGLETTG